MGNNNRPPNFSKYCYALLQHCKKIRDRINQNSYYDTVSKVENTPRKCLSFLSFHRKGNDDVDSIIKEEISKCHILI